MTHANQERHDIQALHLTPAEMLDESGATPVLKPEPPS